MTDSCGNGSEFTFPIDLEGSRITTANRENRQYFEVDFVPTLPSIIYLQEAGQLGGNFKGEDGLTLTTKIAFSEGFNGIRALRKWLVREKNINCDQIDSGGLIVHANIATVSSLLLEKGLIPGTQQKLIDTLKELHQQRGESNFIAPSAPIQSSFMVAMLAEEARPPEKPADMKEIERFRQNRLNRRQGPDSGKSKF